MKVEIRVNHFPHNTDSYLDEITTRGVSHLEPLVAMVAYFNENIVPQLLYSDDAPLDPDDFNRFVFNAFGSWASKHMKLIRLPTNTYYDFYLLYPTNDVVNEIYALMISPHDDDTVIHFVTISFENYVNKYLAIRIAKTLLPRFAEYIESDTDVAYGMVAIVFDTNSNDVEYRRIYDSLVF